MVHLRTVILLGPSRFPETVTSPLTVAGRGAGCEDGIGDDRRDGN